MKQILASVLLLAATSLHAQTARVAHHSHNGDDASFNMVSADGNFGLGPEQIKERNAIRDSLQKKAVTDSINLAKKIISDSLSQSKNWITADSVNHTPIHRKSKVKSKNKSKH